LNTSVQHVTVLVQDEVIGISERGAGKREEKNQGNGKK
jgi:hypothetical protein